MKLKIAGIALLTSLSTQAAPAAESAARVERKLRAMGTDLTIVVDAPLRSQALEAGERAFAALQAAEARLSTWKPDSEMSRLNTAPPGEPFEISEALARDLNNALRCSSETDGAFTPGLGRLVQAWGLRVGGSRPATGEIEDLLPALSARNLIVADGTATRVDGRFVVEEGAFGKGVGLDDATAALAATPASAAVIDLGGQVSVWGGTVAEIELADPRDRSRTVLGLELAHGSIATTGNSERGIVVDGLRLGHVLDPATGRPSRDFGSITVWADQGWLADCLSTGLYVMGSDRALEWAASRPEIGVIAIERDEHGLRARASKNLRDRLRVVADGIDLQFHEQTRKP